VIQHGTCPGRPGRARRLPALLVGFALAAACASAPRSPILDQTAAVGSSAPVQDAKEWAPQAFAHAEQLRQRAEEAHASGLRQEAAALAEQALAAYEHAVILARAAQATQRVATAKQQLSVEREQLRALESAQREVAAQADALELEYKVARDAEPLHPIEAADATREAARRTAARSILQNARLLCLAARLLDSDAPVTPLQQRADALEATLQTSPRPTPIDEAVSLRSACLSLLTDVRREGHRKSPAEDPADVLLSQLSTALDGAAPFRDDRGVVVPLWSAFGKSGALSDGARAQLARLAEIAAANPSFAVMAVVHGPGNSASATRELQKWLASNGLGKAPVEDAAERLPATVLPVRGAPTSTGRIEFVFVAR